MKNQRTLFILVAAAVFIKLALFAFAAVHAPQSILITDSESYLRPAEILYTDGAFATRGRDGALSYEVFRTPGYPLFLAVTHHGMRIPLGGVVFIQVLLTVLAALFTYQAAARIDPRLCLLSAAIVLFDIPTTVASLILMTEALYVFLLSLFILGFILYLKRGAVNGLALSALTLVAATYVRPVSYYLGVAAAVFVLCVNIPKDLKKSMAHALIFFVIVYGLLGAWQARNYARCRERAFASIEHLEGKTGELYKSYSTDFYPFAKETGPVSYYINAMGNSLLGLMTSPGSLKYFKSRLLQRAGKVIGYPWVVFWLAGFLAGIPAIRRNRYHQFLALTILYFLCATIPHTKIDPGDRFRVPIVPCLAIISAQGWLFLSSLMKKTTAPVAHPDRAQVS